MRAACASHRANGCVAAAIGVARRHRRDPAPQPPQLGPRFLESRTDPGPDSICERRNSGLTWAPSKCLEFGQHDVGRVAHDIARRPIDEEILLLDAERELGLSQYHANAASA